MYVWAAIDYDTRELLAIKTTKGRSELEAVLFLKEVLKKCKNKPTFMVDKGRGTSGPLKLLDFITTMKLL